MLVFCLMLWELIAVGSKTDESIHFSNSRIDNAFFLEMLKRCAYLKECYDNMLLMCERELEITINIDYFVLLCKLKINSNQSLLIYVNEVHIPVYFFDRTNKQCIFLSFEAVKYIHRVDDYVYINGELPDISINTEFGLNLDDDLFCGVSCKGILLRESVGAYHSSFRELERFYTNCVIDKVDGLRLDGLREFKLKGNKIDTLDWLYTDKTFKHSDTEKSLRNFYNKLFKETDGVIGTLKRVLCGCYIKKSDLESLRELANQHAEVLSEINLGSTIVSLSFNDSFVSALIYRQQGLMVVELRPAAWN